MSAVYEPNPPSRKPEDFPKTNTMPEGWVMEEIMNAYNTPETVNNRGAAADMQPNQVPVPTTGGHDSNAVTHTVNGNGHNGSSAVTEPANMQGANHAVSDPALSNCEGLFTRRLDPSPSAWDLTGLYL